MREHTVQHQGPTKGDSGGSVMGGGKEVHRFLPAHFPDIVAIDRQTLAVATYLFVRSYFCVVG